MANKLSTGDNSTLTTVPVAAVTAPSFAFEGDRCVFYTRDAAAGSTQEPAAFNAVVEITKETTADTFAVGADVCLNVTNQTAEKSGGDGRMGVAHKASSATDTTVVVRLNEPTAAGSGAVTLAAAATELVVSSPLTVVTGDAGANTVATITGPLAYAGSEITLLFVDTNVTITDTAGHTANTVDLSAAFTSADDTILKLVHDGTSWYETSRSVN